MFTNRINNEVKIYPLTVKYKLTTGITSCYVHSNFEINIYNYFFGIRMTGHNYTTKLFSLQMDNLKQLQNGMTYNLKFKSHSLKSQKLFERNTLE